MGDYFLEYELDEEGTVIGRSITADDQDDWYTEPLQDPDPYEEWLNTTVEGLRHDRDWYKQQVENWFQRFHNTDAILRTMTIDDEHKAKLRALGYLSEVVF